MRMRTTLAIGVLALTAGACGAVPPSAGGGDIRSSPPAAQIPAVSSPDVIPVEAGLPVTTPDELIFKPVPVPVQPPAPKPDRSLPTPPPDRGVLTVPQPDVPVVAAVADLAGRLGIPVEEIEILDARAVTWRDGSVGCPEPGLAYTQAEVPGFLVVLRVDDASYRYHAGAGSSPFLCETPQAPLGGSA